MTMDIFLKNYHSYDIFSFIFILAISLYILTLFSLINGWRKIMYFKPIPLIENIKKKISVIIAIRNEEKYIGDLLNDLSRQTHNNFEVILIDDNSTDGTKKIIYSFIEKNTILVKYLELGNYEGTPKKAAILRGITEAKGEIIVTTDGDCRVGRNWLENIHNCFQTYHPKLISGPVTFIKEKGFFEKIQSIELMALIATGAAGIHYRNPNMCNGANLAYTKKIFKEVGGFDNNTKIASGDDEFLMHKIAIHYPNDIFFLKNKESIVATYPQKRLGNFFQQRKRWASKWKYYTNHSAKFTAIGVYCFHCLLVVFILLSVVGVFSPLLFFILFSSKFLVEYLFIAHLVIFFQKEKFILYILPLSVIYSFYVVIVGLLSLKREYVWKGRKWK